MKCYPTAAGTGNDKVFVSYSIHFCNGSLGAVEHGFWLYGGIVSIKFQVHAIWPL